MQTDDHNIIFLHLSKTGGTTLKGVLERQFPQGRFYRVKVRDGKIDNLAERVQEEKGIAGIQGHFSFGVHEQLQNPSIYFTMLREPVSRVISHYAHTQRENHPLHHTFAGMTIHEFLETPTGQNLQTRRLSNTPQESPVDLDSLEQAKKNLDDHIAVVGLTEFFDESLLMLRTALKWRGSIFYERRNTKPKNARNYEFSSDDIEAIKIKNQLDIDLYHHALKKFENQKVAYGAFFFFFKCFS